MDMNNEKFPFYKTVNGAEFPRANSYEIVSYEKPYNNFEESWRQQGKFLPKIFSENENIWFPIQYSNQSSPSGLDNRQVAAFMIPMLLVFTVVCVCFRCCIKRYIEDEYRPRSVTNIVAHTRTAENNFGTRRARNLPLNVLEVISERHRDREAMIHGRSYFPEDSFAYPTYIEPRVSAQRDYFPPRAPSPPPKYSTVVAVDSSLPSYKDCVAV